MNRVADMEVDASSDDSDDAYGDVKNEEDELHLKFEEGRLEF